MPTLNQFLNRVPESELSRIRFVVPKGVGGSFGIMRGWLFKFVKNGTHRFSKEYIETPSGAPGKTSWSTRPKAGNMEIISVNPPQGLRDETLIILGKGCPDPIGGVE